jgi:hypothetical protein
VKRHPSLLCVESINSAPRQGGSLLLLLLLLVVTIIIITTTTTTDPTLSCRQIAIYSPSAGDVMTVTVAGTSVTTTARQYYAIVASGSFYSSVWYCQNTLANRTDATYTTGFCGYKVMMMVVMMMVMVVVVV